MAKPPDVLDDTRSSNGVTMEDSPIRIEQPAPPLARAGAHSRSFAKDIAELALFLDLTEPPGPGDHLDAAAAELAAERRIPATTLKRCASEARALIEFAGQSGALQEIGSPAHASEWDLRQAISAWLDDTSLPTVLKERALRLNRRRGGRPATSDRTLRAVEELVEFARAGRPGALDELRSIRALIANA
jgi:hypothetical protein